MALTAKQERFIEEYVVDLNAAAAYRRAGYAVANDNVAAVEGHRLLSNPKIAEAVRVKQQERSAEVELTTREVIAGLRREAALTGEGSSHGARVTAWSWLGRHLAMFTDKHEHAFPDEDVDRALEEELQGLSARRASQGGGPLPPPRGPGEPAANGRHDG